MITTDDLQSLKGVAVSWFGYDPSEEQWILVFTDGQRLILSAGPDAEYSLAGRLH